MKLYSIFLACFSMHVSSAAFSQADSPEIRTINNRLDSVAQLRTELIAELEVLKLKWIQEELQSVGLPTGPNRGETVVHKAMVLNYNEEHEQANWVSHIILPDAITGKYSRSNDFREDPLITTGSAQEIDYFVKKLKADGETYSYDGYGFDRGHLAPSADFKWCKSALSESYLYSNMSPQLGDFNRFKWAQLENWMRSYVAVNEVNLVVVTAPVLNKELKKSERSVNGVSIPEYYIKAVLDKKNKRAIAFMMPNKKIALPIESFAVSVDSAETVLGYDLFSGLDDVLEDEIEKKTEYAFWLPPAQQGDVVEIDEKRLPKKANSTYLIHIFKGDGKKHTVCGKVVAATKHEKGHVFINLDKKFPNQIFSVSIFESNIRNFDYEPEQYLIDKEVCFTGEIGEYNGTPNMVLDNGKQVKLLNEY